ncbi:hypothetical protein CP965_07730 [Halarcobacter mediterraneus]|uniref:HTH tetR-type domain-containing protein n=1 Tax=Halarcobacter mediterraneus TaxID=2023153 RepID=A0A4Q1B1K5_9BACT|nr:TetR/AcrR family transcriptional regulator [Halarcobacter mediterraneus]RXK12466.1 hypothetical protein CP965_07730 [Halarcobacter mediterraneus]
MSSKERLLKVTFDEVYENGYYATSVDKILKKAKLNKGSMYHFFKSKKELMLAVIDAHIFEYIDKKYSEILKTDKNYIDEMFKVLYNKETFNFTFGCRLNTLVQELSHHDKDFKEALEKVYFHFEKVLEQVLQKASDNNEIEYSDIKGLAVFVVACIEGALSTAKKSQDGKHFETCIKQLEEFFKKIEK